MNGFWPSSCSFLLLGLCVACLLCLCCCFSLDSRAIARAMARLRRVRSCCSCAEQTRDSRSCLQLSTNEMASDAGPSGRPDRVEGMGWLTESSVQPRKRRAIEGAGSVPDSLSWWCSGTSGSIGQRKRAACRVLDKGTRNKASVLSLNELMLRSKPRLVLWRRRGRRGAGGPAGNSVPCGGACAAGARG